MTAASGTTARTHAATANASLLVGAADSAERTACVVALASDEDDDDDDDEDDDDDDDEDEAWLASAAAMKSDQAACGHAAATGARRAATLYTHATNAANNECISSAGAAGVAVTTEPLAEAEATS